MTPTFFKRLNSIIDMSFYKLSHSEESTLEEGHRQLAETDKFTLIELHVESEHEIRKSKIEHDNWMVSYKLKPELERIVWRSKLYSKEKVVTKSQSLVERTENQVDIALKKFCNWFQSVFDDTHSHVTEDYIKKLFSSGFEIHPAALSIYIEPKQVFSIPHQVAEKYNVPELSTKNQKKKLMNLDEMAASPVVPATNIAFGKCLPTCLKQPKRVIDDCMKPNFPDELRTDEYLFKGIEDLRYIDGIRSSSAVLSFFDAKGNI
ncbi:hypothetical protein HA402_000081 [Bradysia odoriphaga]|nr:hypothetical protein HA402_000081 [Bradysia odoriphaga]